VHEKFLDDVTMTILADDVSVDLLSTQEYLEYQRQLALQRMHEQEMEMRRRLELQKQEQQMRAMQYSYPQVPCPPSTFHSLLLIQSYLSPSAVPCFFKRTLGQFKALDRLSTNLCRTIKVLSSSTTVNSGCRQLSVCFHWSLIDSQDEFQTFQGILVIFSNDLSTF